MLRLSSRWIILIIGLVLVGKESFSQINSLSDNQLWIKADKDLGRGDFLEAYNKYSDLILRDSNSPELNYSLGICCFNISRLRKDSETYFEKVSPNLFPEVLFYKGRLCHLSRQYEKSIAYFEDYKSIKDFKEFDDEITKILIDKCKTAMLFEATFDNTIQIKNIGKEINSEFSDYAPLITADREVMLFTSRRENATWTEKDPYGDYYENIFISQSVDGKWQDPVMLGSGINSKLHDACTGLSADGSNFLMFRTSEDLRSGDIYECSLQGGGIGLSLLCLEQILILRTMQKRVRAILLMEVHCFSQVIEKEDLVVKIFIWLENYLWETGGFHLI